MAGAMSKWRGFGRATKSARACYSQVINVRFNPARLAQHPPGKAVAGEGPIYPLPTEHLRNAALRLAAELDDAALYKAAAYASMVADAIADSRGETQVLDLRTNVDLDFELDEHGRVWMIREGDCHIIGRRDAVCAEMRRFLRTVVLGDDPG
jgi:hypothetical protein